jgi:hypothetical protein
MGGLDRPPWSSVWESGGLRRKTPPHWGTIQLEARFSAWTLKKEGLSAFVNAAEWPLNPSIGSGPTINFILYVATLVIGMGKRRVKEENPAPLGDYPTRSTVLLNNNRGGMDIEERRSERLRQCCRVATESEHRKWANDQFVSTVKLLIGENACRSGETYSFTAASMSHEEGSDPGVNPEYDETEAAWTLKKEGLSAFVNAAEWPLNPSIGSCTCVSTVKLLIGENACRSGETYSFTAASMSHEEGPFHCLPPDLNLPRGTSRLQ